uniref:Integron gene cassette protein n=1 Tax=Macrostomum lignano TaxID=282301 RepID=A0A1I8FFM6_9PLAT
MLSILRRAARRGPLTPPVMANFACHVERGNSCASSVRSRSDTDEAGADTACNELAPRYRSSAVGRLPQRRTGGKPTISVRLRLRMEQQLGERVLISINRRGARRVARVQRTHAYQ